MAKHINRCELCGSNEDLWRHFRISGKIYFLCNKCHSLAILVPGMDRGSKVKASWWDALKG